MTAIISRREAQIAGLKRYSTGLPCVNGHISDRLVANRTCAECNRSVARIWKIANASQVRAYMRSWDAANPQRRRANGLARRSTSHGCLNHRMGAATSRCLLGRKSGRSWQVLVGYTAEDLRLHIERQFTKGMGWHNRHLWHIDHILPLTSFRFNSAEDPEFRAAWALSNLRPLWAPKNMSKYTKREFLL